MRRKKALIVRMGQIGDVVMTIPAVRYLYDQGFEIHWVCGKTVQPLLECYPWITLLPVDDKAILIGRPLQRMNNIIQLWRRLILKKYDLCATLYYDRRYRILTLPVQAKRKVALSRESRATTLLAGRSYTDEFARILLDAEDGYRPQSLQPVRPDVLPPSPIPVKISERRIAIVPGGASNFHAQQVQRRWPVELYTALAAMLHEKGWEVVLLGGPEDVWVLPYFRHIPVTDCIGKLSVPEVISVCDTCDAVISHDTGPMHLAGISHACVLGLFGSTNPGNVLPRRPRVAGIWGGEGFACRPCYDGRTYPPCQHVGCMREITPEIVVRQLDNLLEGRPYGVLTPSQITILSVYSVLNSA